MTTVLPGPGSVTACRFASIALGLAEPPCERREERGDHRVEGGPLVARDRELALLRLEELREGGHLRVARGERGRRGAAQPDRRLLADLLRARPGST